MIGGGCVTGCLVVRPSIAGRSGKKVGFRGYDGNAVTLTFFFNGEKIQSYDVDQGRSSTAWKGILDARDRV